MIDEHIFFCLSTTLKCFLDIILSSNIYSKYPQNLYWQRLSSVPMLTSDPITHLHSHTLTHMLLMIPHPPWLWSCAVIDVTWWIRQSQRCTCRYPVTHGCFLLDGDITCEWRSFSFNLQSIIAVFALKEHTSQWSWLLSRVSKPPTGSVILTVGQRKPVRD